MEQKTLFLTQLNEDLSGPKENGLKRIVVQDREDADLGYEGSHMYKRNGKYYIFTCHMEKERKKRKTVLFQILLQENLSEAALLTMIAATMALA